MQTFEINYRPEMDDIMMPQVRKAMRQKANAERRAVDRAKRHAAYRKKASEKLRKSLAESGFTGMPETANPKPQKSLSEKRETRMNRHRNAVLRATGNSRAITHASKMLRKAGQ